LALLNRAFRLAVKKKRLSPRCRPDIELPPEDETSIRQGFFRRAEVERLCQHLPATIADVVQFLFFCPWRIGAARGLEWRDYSEPERALTLRRELNKTKRPLQIPVDAESTPELMTVIERQKARRRPDCPFIFHGRHCGTPRLDKHGHRRSCLGDFQKVWDRACVAIRMAGRTPHDLRRSGVKHYIDAGVDPHTGWRGPGTGRPRCSAATTSSTSTTSAGPASARATIGGRRRTSSRATSDEPSQNRPSPSEIQGLRRCRR